MLDWRCTFFLFSFAKSKEALVIEYWGGLEVGGG